MNTCTAHDTTIVTVSLQSNAAATIHFAAGFVWLLFEGGVYFFLESLETSTTAG